MTRRDEAKQADLVAVLASYGYSPVKTHGARAWFKSPFRRESVPSFVVNLHKNTWNDYGTGERGDVISFVLQYDGCEFHEALDRILGDSSTPVRQHDPEAFEDKEHGILILDVQEITNHGLISYAESRGISAEVLKAQCKQVNFLFRGNANGEHVAIGFKNIKGGWELRNQRHKVGNSPKSWSMIRGSGGAGADVFEGFFDYLSHLKFNGFDVPYNDSYILNSLVFSEWVLPDLNEYGTVNMYLDNDGPAQEKMDGYFTGERFNDCRGVFKDHEDYNAFLMDLMFNK